MKFLKTVFVAMICSMICIEMTFSTMAMAAQAEKSNVAMMKQFLQVSGLNEKNLTIGDVYRNIYPDLSDEMVRNYHGMMLFVQDQKMPSIEAVTFMDKNKTEQVRLVMEWNKKTYSIESEGYGKNFKIKFGNSSFTEDDIKKPGTFIAALQKEIGETKNAPVTKLQDLTLMPTKKQWSSWSAVQKAQYLTMLRYLVDDVDKTLDLATAKTAKNETEDVDKFSLIFELLNPEACAAENLGGQPCLIGGWVSKYGTKTQSCGGSEEGNRDLSDQIKSQWSSSYKSAASCSNSEVPCNPTFYGFDGNKPYCVSRVKRDQIRYMTRNCNQQSPLRKSSSNEFDDVKRIIESHLKIVSGDATKKIIGVKPDQNGVRTIYLEKTGDWNIVKSHLDTLQSSFKTAMGVCSKDPITEIKEDQDIPNYADLTKRREDQKSACEEIRKRYFTLQNYKMSTSPIGGGTTPGQAATDVVAGTPPPGGANCTYFPSGPPVCDRVVASPAPPVPSPAVTPLPPKPANDQIIIGDTEKKPKEGFCEDKKGNFNCGGLLLAGGLLVAGIVLVNRQKAKSPNVTNPYYDPNTSNTTPVTTPVTTPTPTNPTVAPPPVNEGSSLVPAPTNTGSGSIRKPGQR